MEAQEQAKQLDSVTDRFEEKEVDAEKAREAITSLATTGASRASDKQLVSVDREDVESIVSELEVTNEVAEKILREVADEANAAGEPPILTALRKLVTSTSVKT